MRFKNLSVYQLAPGNPLLGIHAAAALALLSERLPFCAFQPCPPLQAESVGFSPPFDTGGLYDIVRLVGMEGIALCLQIEKRLISAAALKEETEVEVRRLEAIEGKAISKGRIKDIKARLRDKDLAKAQTIKKRLNALLDARDGLIYIDSANPAQCESLVHWLRVALQTFPATPLRYNAVPIVMSGWLRANVPVYADRGEHLAILVAANYSLSLPPTLQLGAEITMESNDDPPALVRLKNIADTHPTVQAYLSDGFLPTSLDLFWGASSPTDSLDRRMAFTLDMSARIKGIDLIYRSPDHEAAQNKEETFDADALLFLGEARALLADMDGWFGSRVEIAGMPPPPS